MTRSEDTLQGTREDQRGFFGALIGDGRPLLTFTGLSLALSGAFALFLAASGYFLPHDVLFLGMTAEELCEVEGCRIVHFMTHDRVAFGGSLIAIGLLYLWAAAFLLRRGEAWAWWLFVVTGLTGFGSFLAYLGYLARNHDPPAPPVPRHRPGKESHALVAGVGSMKSLSRPVVRVRWGTLFGAGRALLLATAAGMVAGGATITFVGMTSVFVPQDPSFMGLSAPDLHDANPRLVPLIAHDRAGFDGGIGTTGIAAFFCVWCGAPSRGLWQALLLSGAVGFSTVVGVHPVVGYNDLVHLAPAILGALMFATGLALTYGPVCKRPRARIT